MRYIFALLPAVVAWGVVPASSKECQLSWRLASLNETYIAELGGHRPEPDKAARVKEGEFESPEMIAAIERNREDRERTVVMDR
jgi:hypothetical protein